MTPEQQRITIAEFCGWTDIEPCTCHNGQTRGFQPIKGAHKKHTPDYLNDLNSMHEAEKVIRNNQRGDFSIHLQRITGGEWFLCYNSTAAQRAEALLKTIGKWEETK
jgi:hypothetical protein